MVFCRTLRPLPCRNTAYWGFIQVSKVRNLLLDGASRVAARPHSVPRLPRRVRANQDEDEDGDDDDDDDDEDDEDEHEDEHSNNYMLAGSAWAGNPKRHRDYGVVFIFRTQDVFNLQRNPECCMGCDLLSLVQILKET